jgi:DnaK suppressor protein
MTKTKKSASKKEQLSWKHFLKSVKAILLAQKEGLLGQKSEIIIDADGDEVDQIQAGILLTVDKQLGKRNAERLRAIEMALTRIQNKTYGLCLDCGEQIPEKRLLINPVFQVCVGCAEERERTR